MRGSPLVLLSGMNCTEDVWGGCGLDAATPPLTRPSVDDEVAHLAETLPDRVVLGGLSLGAIVAMAFAVRFPERVAGLVLVATNAKAPTPAQQEGWRAWRERLDAGESPRKLQASILDLLLSAPVRDARPDLVERTLAMGAATPPDVLAAQLSLQSSRRDLLASLPRLTVPALVVAGAADALCPPSFLAEIAAALPRARMTTLDAGHLVPLERPAATGATVGAWLAELY